MTKQQFAIDAFEEEYFKILELKDNRSIVLVLLGIALIMRKIMI